MNAVVKAEAPQFTPVLYDRMTKAIAECERLDELKDLHDKSVALHEYARQARNVEAERSVQNIRLRAEWEMGRLIKEGQADGTIAKRGGDRKSKSPDTTLIDQPKTLAEFGITKDESSRYQQLNDIPKPQFEEILEQSSQKLTATGILESTQPVFACTCGESFSSQVWHCQSCGHHWPMEEGQCRNCHESRDKKPVVAKIKERVLRDTDPDRNAKPKKKVADVVYMQTRLNAQAKAENHRSDPMAMLLYGCDVPRVAGVARVAVARS